MGKKRIRRKRKIDYIKRRITWTCFLLFLFALGFFLGRYGQAQDVSVTHQEEKSVKRNVQKEEVPLEKEVKAEGQKRDWNLTLVNKDNLMAKDYEPKLEEIQGLQGYYFDSRAIGQLNNMIEDGNKAGLSLWICSAYRSVERQRELYENKVNAYEREGFTHQKACEKAKKEVAYPGTSEHALGLAVDIVSKNYQILDDRQAKTLEAQWLKENCYKYGFILRYPIDKGAITGIIFEPWHFRYVGIEAATEIMKKGICLEEYLNQHFK